MFNIMFSRQSHSLIKVCLKKNNLYELSGANFIKFALLRKLNILIRQKKWGWEIDQLTY